MPYVHIYEYEAYPVYAIGEAIEDDDHVSDRYDTRKVSHEFIARYNMIMAMYGQMQKELYELEMSDPIPEVIVPLHTRPFEELGEWIEQQINKQKE